MKRALSSLIENTDVREFKIVNIEVEKITESKTQARTFFDENKLSELSESIKKSGVLQPIIVQLLTTTSGPFGLGSKAFIGNTGGGNTSGNPPASADRGINTPYPAQPGIPASTSFYNVNNFLPNILNLNLNLFLRYKEFLLDPIKYFFSFFLKNLLFIV